METLPLWLVKYWPIILIVTTLIAKILDSITKHFSEHKGLVKWCLWIINVLNIFKTTPAPLNKTKSGVIIKTLLPVLFITLAAPGCAGWQVKTRQSLTGAQHASKALYEIARPFYKARCGQLASEVKKAGCSSSDKASVACKPLVDCQGQRDLVHNWLDRLQLAIVVGYSFLEVGEQGGAEEMLVKALGLMGDINNLLTKAGLI